MTRQEGIYKILLAYRDYINPDSIEDLRDYHKNADYFASTIIDLDDNNYSFEDFKSDWEYALKGTVGEWIPNDKIKKIYEEN